MRITRRNMFNREANEFNTYDLNITEDQLKAYNDGELIQRAFPNLNADEREFIMTGCPIGSWDEIVDGSGMIDITEELFHQPELFTTEFGGEFTTEEVVTGRLTKREMDAVADVIYNWDQWGLGIDFRTEVIWSALNALKRNPEISIAEALDCGIAEWIK